MEEGQHVEEEGKCRRRRKYVDEEETVEGGRNVDETGQVDEG